MQLSLSEEQTLVRDSFANFFRKESTPERVRAAECEGVDPKLWAGLVDLGAPLMRAPEAQGGSGSSLLDAAVVAEEVGRHLASGPLLEVLVAARLLASLGERAQPWLSAVGAGEKIVTLSPQPLTPGKRIAVPGIAAADAVLGISDDRVVLLELPERPQKEPNLGSLAIAPFAPPEAADARYHLLEQSESALATVHSGVEEWKMLRAAAVVGAAQRSLQMAAQYACERMAFGRPIGSYQGLSHPLADSAADVDGARLLLWRAIESIHLEEPEAAALVSQAFWWAAHVGPLAVHRALRTFGGYGLAMEYDIQLYLRRVKAWILLGGDPDLELTRIGDRLWQNGEVALPPAGDSSISFQLGDAADRFADRVRQFFRDNLTEELRRKAHHSTAGHDPQLHRKLAEANLSYPDWPEADGGEGAGRYEVYASRQVFEDVGWTFFVLGTTGIVASAIRHFGSDRARDEVLPKIKSGDVIASLGFSEPECGSDVFAARTMAVRDGDDWIISGQKMFTTGAHLSDYVLLLTRTDPKAKKHAGLTLFLVPLDAEGVEVQKVDTLMSERTNITYYQDVRVPDYLRIGEVNAGAVVMSEALQREQGGADFHVAQRKMLAQALCWAARFDDQGVRPLDEMEVRRRLARVVTRVNVAEVLVRRDLWAGEEGIASRAYGPMSKLFATESYAANSWELMQLAAPHSLFDSDEAPEDIELHHRRAYGTTIYAGTSEILRSIIAEHALGLPRTRS